MILLGRNTPADICDVHMRTQFKNMNIYIIGIQLMCVPTICEEKRHGPTVVASAPSSPLSSHVERGSACLYTHTQTHTCLYVLFESVFFVSSFI